MFTWLIYGCNVHRWNLPYRNNIYPIWVSGVKKLWKGDWDLNGGKPSESIVRCSINQAIWCQHFNQTCTVSMNKTYFFFTRGNHSTTSIIWWIHLPYPVDHHPNRMYSEIRMAPIGSRYTSSDTWYCSYILLEPDPYQKAKLYTIIIIKCYTNQKKKPNLIIV